MSGRKRFDPVTRPRHYVQGRIEVLDFIEDQDLGFHMGGAVKYIARAAHKGTEIEDLQKARCLLDRKIALLGGR